MTTDLAAIFDMDGVIVHSNPAHKKTIKRFCERHGKDVSEEFLQRRLYGRTNKEWIPELMGDISQARLKELADEKEQQFRDNFDPEKNVVHGLCAFLNQLKTEGISMAVATSAPIENADYILSALEIEPLFDAVLHSAHVNKGKPDPEIYLKAAKALNKKPENCIVFEDSLAGVEAGARAGYYVIGVTTTHSKEELEICDLVIDNFDQIAGRSLAELVHAKIR